MHVTRDGLVFDIDVCGPEDGRPALLLHGFPQTARSWDRVVPRLVEVGVRCFAMNQRGYSPGARPANLDAYAMSHLAADALATVEHISPDSPIDLVGHDWGASVAWYVAARHPGRVRSLTAISVPHLAAYGYGLRHDGEQRRMTSYMTDWRTEPELVERLLDDRAAGLRRFVTDRLPSDAFERYLEVLGDPEGLRGALAWYQANGRELHDLEPVRTPTTFMWGADDAYISAGSARRCADYVGVDYRYVELDDVSHWVPEEVPEIVAREIIRRMLSA